ncbi:MAG TPA: hypothetical protein VHI51_14395 [Ktedonobacterales bacterium]|nr:hypothetical protein [Ktedonobacterales bacterium]
MTRRQSRPTDGWSAAGCCWLLLARLVGAGIVVLALTVFGATTLRRFAALRVVCATSCRAGQLTSGQAAALGQFGISLEAYALFAMMLTVTTSLVWFGAAALIFWRRTDTLFLLLAATQLATQGALNSPAGPAVMASHPLIFPVATSTLTTLNIVLFVVFLALFPTGRFTPRWLGWLMIPACAALIATQFPPFTAEAQEQVILACLIGLIVAQGYRYRAVSTPLQRQQTRWVILGIALNVVVQVVLSIVPVIAPALAAPGTLFPVVAGSVSTLALAVAPIAFTVAVLRYRLFDLDVLLNRTLVYGSLSALLAAIYVGCVFALQAAARGVTGQQSSAAAITVSTLLIATLFQPMRRRIQTFIDLRFYRRKYDAAKTLTAFSATLRSEVDLENLCRELVTVVDTSLQPTRTWLLVRPTSGVARAWQAG